MNGVHVQSLDPRDAAIGDAVRRLQLAGASSIECTMAVGRMFRACRDQQGQVRLSLGRGVEVSLPGRPSWWQIVPDYN